MALWAVRNPPLPNSSFSIAKFTELGADHTISSILKIEISIASLIDSVALIGFPSFNIAVIGRLFGIFFAGGGDNFLFTPWLVLEEGTDIRGVQALATPILDTGIGLLSCTDRGGDGNLDSDCENIELFEESITKRTWTSFRFGNCEILLHEGPRSLANTSMDIPLSLFSKCLLHAFTILGIVTSWYGNSTNSWGPVRSYFLAFPVASVAKGCTVISFLSKIDTSLAPPFFCPAPDLAVFFCIYVACSFRLYHIGIFSPLCDFRHV